MFPEIEEAQSDRKVLLQAFSLLGKSVELDFPMVSWKGQAQYSHPLSHRVGITSSLTKLKLSTLSPLLSWPQVLPLEA